MGRSAADLRSYPYPSNFLLKTIHEHILIFVKPLPAEPADQWSSATGH